VLRRNTDARRVTYSFSNTDYEFTVNRSGLLFATHPETREVTQLDLSEITADQIAKVGSTDMSIELNPDGRAIFKVYGRADEPPRIEGRQLLHFESKSLLHIWYQNLISMLTSIAERRQHGSEGVEKAYREAMKLMNSDNGSSDWEEGLEMLQQLTGEPEPEPEPGPEPEPEP
jgi:hypothetical protein